MLKMLGKSSVLLLLFVAACTGRAGCFGRASQSSGSVPAADAAPDAAVLVVPDASVEPECDASPAPPADAGDCPE